MARWAPAALCLLVLCCAAHAAEVKLTPGSAGCADLPPSPPTALKATPGDGEIALSWKGPANGACVSEFQVTVLPVDGSQRAAPLPRQATPAFNLTVSGLANGVQYKLFVRAVSAKYGPVGEAQVVAAPSAACLPQLLPSAPTNLTALPQGTDSVKLCWGPVANGACVDEWRVAIRDASGRSAAPTRYERVSLQGTCLVVRQLNADVLYEFAVQAYSAQMRGGAFAKALAAPIKPPQAWRCESIAAYYPLCGAATAGACTPLSCAQQAALGQCGAPFVRIRDEASKTVFQFCADVCGGCKLDAPTSAAARAANVTSGGAEAPLVTKFDGGITDAIANKAAANETKGNSAAAPAAGAAQDYMKWDGCCAGPVRSFNEANDDGEGASLVA